MSIAVCPKSQGFCSFLFMCVFCLVISFFCFRARDMVLSALYTYCYSFPNPVLAPLTPFAFLSPLLVVYLHPSSTFSLSLFLAYIVIPSFIHSFTHSLALPPFFFLLSIYIDSTFAPTFFLLACVYVWVCANEGEHKAPLLFLLDSTPLVTSHKSWRPPEKSITTE